MASMQHSAADAIISWRCTGLRVFKNANAKDILSTCACGVQ